MARALSGDAATGQALSSFQPQNPQEEVRSSLLKVTSGTCLQNTLKTKALGTGGCPWTHLACGNEGSSYQRAATSHAVSGMTLQPLVSCIQIKTKTKLFQGPLKISN